MSRPEANNLHDQRSTVDARPAPADRAPSIPSWLATQAADLPSRGARNASPPKIAGYQVIELLGEGAMGTVWRAIQLGTRREVALKLVSAEVLGSEQLRRRFKREVELAAKIEHPNVARVYDAGLHEGAYYYAMELVRGLPLDDFARANHLDDRQVVGLMRRVCRAIEQAHALGIIHRDLKPSNILVTGDAQPHVLDFGLAKATDLAIDSSSTLSGTLTLHGEIAGTPAYMSPEQAAGNNDLVSARSDVWALGAMLYELLVGQLPHDGAGGYVELLRRITTDEPRKPRLLKPALDAELEAIVLKCLRRDPENRYDSVFALHVDLTRYLRGDPTSVQPPDPFGLRATRHRSYPFAGDVDRFAPTALSLAGIAALAAVVFKLDETGVRWFAAIRFCVLLACYAVVLVPLGRRGMREATQWLGFLMPKDAWRRTFAAFAPTWLLAVAFWMTGGGTIVSAVLGLAAGFLVTVGGLFLLFHIHPRDLLLWVFCAAAPVALGAVVCAATLWAANLGLHSALTKAGHLDLFPASPFGPGLPW